MAKVGGLVGDNRQNEGKQLFWYVETSGQLASDGGMGKTTAEMHRQSTFTAMDWDFAGEDNNGTQDTWWILESRDYPRLSWESTVNSLK